MSDSVRVLDSTLADEHLALLRDRDTPSPAFRRAVGCLTTLVIAEALRDLEARESTVTTPMAVAHVRRAARRITVIPILRAGLAMLDPALALMPDRARVGFLGMARDEATLKPRVYLESIPDDLSADDVVALDVMVATGGSCVAALDEIARVVAPGGYLLLSTVGEQFPALMLGTPQPDGQERAAIDQSYAHYHYYSTAGLSDELAARGLRVLGSASYIDAAQARWCYRLRVWEQRQGRLGLVRRLNQLRRAPLGLALVPWMFRLHAPPDRGAGLAVIAQRPA